MGDHVVSTICVDHLKPSEANGSRSYRYTTTLFSRTKPREMMFISAPLAPFPVSRGLVLENKIPVCA